VLKPSILLAERSNTSSRHFPSLVRGRQHAEGIKRDENQDGASRVTASRQLHQPERGILSKWGRARFAHVHRPSRLPIYFPLPSQLFLLFFFSSPSQCRGFTCISEDSSEITFLLVENYNLTALDQLRKDWLRNFWSPSQSRSSSIDLSLFHCQHSHWECGEEGLPSCHKSSAPRTIAVRRRGCSTSVFLASKLLEHCSFALTRVSTL